MLGLGHKIHTQIHRLKNRLWISRYAGRSQVRIWGGGGGCPPPTPNFEAQIFAAAATPLHNVSKILLGPPLHKSWIHTWI